MLGDDILVCGMRMYEKLNYNSINDVRGAVDIDYFKCTGY